MIRVEMESGAVHEFEIVSNLPAPIESPFPWANADRISVSVTLSPDLREGEQDD